ncbi:MAG: hypothetical protein GX146_12930 [Myxococcales bacterium]|nr:hypothetical protein [Myxococcales bacterium]
MHRTKTIAWLLGIVLSLGTCSLLAQPAGDARLLFEQGTLAFQNEDYAAAAVLFRQSHEVRPSWKLLFNLGQAEAAASAFAEALEAFEDYLVQGGDQVPIERRSMVEAELARLRLLVGFIQIDAEDGLVVQINERTKGETPMLAPIRASAGQNKIALLRDGDVIWARTVSVGSGLVVTVNARTGDDAGGVDAGREGDAAGTSEALPAGEAAGRPMMITGAALLSVGGAVLVTGGVFLGLANKSWHRADDASTHDEPAFHKHNDDFQTRRTVAAVSLSIGAALAIAGAVMVGVAVQRGKDKKTSPPVSLQSGGVAVHF